ncbi:hypothetical protein GUJ93_ZPchr0009g1668 [Zizania palustris]|uniref:Uncharacterized protein n=1 Tax=Zizania palustris TaxID=103762 RepID=A0A8J5RMC7_ZIZPA|nr:hypothetical protein GUJ93_ZPchr0009g1007 [Zizania palustris]KAG8048404.1 hypothetical protein GUJ93_ZPchr0009g1668 [Zizania palustris]
MRSVAVQEDSTPKSIASLSHAVDPHKYQAQLLASSFTVLLAPNCSGKESRRKAILSCTAEALAAVKITVEVCGAHCGKSNLWTAATAACNAYVMDSCRFGCHAESSYRWEEICIKTK